MFASPSLLCAQIFGRQLRQSKCQHHDFYVRMNGVPNRKSGSRFVCAKCHCHLILHNVQNTPCTKVGVLNHHFVVEEVDVAREDFNDQKHSLNMITVRATCINCQFQLRFDFVESFIKVQDFTMILRDNADFNGYSVLRTYVNNLIEVEDPTMAQRSINPNNGKLQKHVNVDNARDLFFAKIGYSFDEESGRLSLQQRDPVASRFLLDEISLSEDTIRQKLAGPASPQAFESANSSIMKSLWLQGRKSETSQDIQRLVNLLHSGTAACFSLLGCLSDMKPRDVIGCYKAQVEFRRTDAPKYLEALCNIAQTTGNMEYQEAAAIETSKGLPTQSELIRAYEFLGLFEGAPVDLLVERYQRLAQEEPDKVSEHKGALRIIQGFVDHPTLDILLQTENQSIIEDMVLDEAFTAVPVGLNNIGNTCYLNSLLQYYFSIKDLRDWVLEHSLSTLDTVPSTAQTFLSLLRDLFKNLLFTKSSSIAPKKQLALMALQTENLSLGQHQDISECMDNIISLLEAGLGTGESGESLVKRLFFGKFRQRLTYRDQSGNVKSNIKDEEFSHLLVDVAEDVYAGLDNFFESTKVEFEKTDDARMAVSILELPEMLTIQVQRVKYNRETASAYKLNDFMRFNSSIFLDRYMDVNIEQTNERRAKRKFLYERLQQVEQEILKNGDQSTSGRLGLAKLALASSMKGDVQEVPGLTELLSVGIANLTDAQSALDSEANQLRSQLNEVYSDMRTIEYRLHAVFIHEGEADFGHYWSYMWDGTNSRWVKFNDTIVTEVQEIEVFGDREGNANAYCLMYCRSDVCDILLQTFARSEEVRSSYRRLLS